MRVAVGVVLAPDADAWTRPIRPSYRHDIALAIEAE